MKTLENAVLARGTNIKDLKAGESVAAKQSLLLVDKPVKVQLTSDLAGVSFGENRLTIAGLAQFPLAVTKTGRFNGKLENFGAYCLRTTGRAATESHAKSLLEKRGLRVGFLNADEKKASSDAYALLQTQYHAAAKTEAMKFHARPDAVLKSAKFTQSADGSVKLATVATIASVKTNAEEVLRLENAKQAEEIAELRKLVSPKVSKRIHKKVEAAPIEVGGVATPVVAPQGATPVAS